MSNDTQAKPAEKKERGPSPILRGVSKGQVTIALWANAPGAKMDLHGYIAGAGGKNRQVAGFFNDKNGKKSISIKEFVPGKDGAADGWKTLGFGNAINKRADGEKVYFDTVVFNLDGKPMGARVTKAGEEFHAKMGFTSAIVKRPKAEADVDTSKEAAAASAEAPARPRQRG